MSTRTKKITDPLYEVLPPSDNGWIITSDGPLNQPLYTMDTLCTTHNLLGVDLAYNLQENVPGIFMGVGYSEKK